MKLLANKIGISNRRLRPTKQWADYSKKLFPLTSIYYHANRQQSLNYITCYGNCCYCYNHYLVSSPSSDYASSVHYRRSRVRVFGTRLVAILR